MTKRLQLFALLIAVCALCYSQGAAGNNALFLSGGYRLNGGEYELSAGYERLLTGRSSFYSLYTSFNYQQIETTMVALNVKDYKDLLESTFLNHVANIENPADLFNPEYMQNAAANSEVFSFHFVKRKLGHADNIRRIEIYIHAPMKNQLIFRQSSYNLRQYDGWSNVKNIFRFF